MQLAFRRRRRAFPRAAAIGLTLAVGAMLALGGSASARTHRGSHTTRHHSALSGGVSIKSQIWGTAHGQTVKLYTLSSGHGMTVKITNYGGVVQSIWVPGRDGTPANVALGFNKLSDYVTMFETAHPAGTSGNAYFGAIIGRYANRIAGASFPLGTQTYTLGQGPPCFLPAAPNNGPNLLHGGPLAYNTQIWGAATSKASDSASLILTYTDPDCYNGFPGAVSNTVTYTLTSDNALKITYKATTTAPTVVNFTNHTYFNLAGEGSGTVYDQLLQLNANTFTPVDTNLIPTGVFAGVGGTPFDFRTMKPIGQDIRAANMKEGQQLVIAHGYDHNWVLGRPGQMKVASVAEDPASGRTLTTSTTEPGVQVYTSNFLVGDLVGTSGHTYRQGDGFTLETQHYPDSPHHQGDPKWPTVVLTPGHTFSSETDYAFSVTPAAHAHRAR